jgi:hypothetical protein
MEALPKEPVSLDHDGERTSWTLQGDGAAGSGEVLPSAGRVFVNNLPVTVTAVRAMPSGIKGSDFLVIVEATALDGSVRLTRRVNLTYSGAATWMDFIVNVTNNPLDVVVDFETAFPGALDRLQDDRKQALPIAGNQITATPESRGMWMTVDQGGPQYFTGWNFAVGPAPSLPRLICDPATRRVRARYQLTLAPFDRKILAHYALAMPVANGQPVDALASRVGGTGGRGMVGLTLPSYLSHAVNFGTATPPPLPPGVPAGAVEASRPRDVFKDGLGFQWTNMYAPCGFATELGCRSGLEIWLDGAPATFIQERADANTNFARVHPAEWSNVAGTINVLRLERVNPAVGTFVQLLELENHSDTAKECRLELVTVMASPVTALLGDSGKALDYSKPIAAADYGGIVAIETQGAAMGLL